MARSSGWTVRVCSHSTVLTAVDVSTRPGKGADVGFRGIERIHDDDLLKAGSAADGRNFFVLSFGRDEGNASFGIDQQQRDLLRRQGGVNGNVDGAQSQGSEVDQGPLPAIFGQQGDAVALHDAPGGEAIGEGVDARHHVRARDRVPIARGVLPEKGAGVVAGGNQGENVYQRLQFEHGCGT